MGVGVKMKRTPASLPFGPMDIAQVQLDELPSLERCSRVTCV
jgi:hypothetical protein